MIQTRYMYEKISTVISEEFTVNAYRHKNVIDIIVAKDLSFVSNLMKSSKKNREILYQLSEVLPHKLVNYEYDFQYTHDLESISIDEIRFKVLDAINENIMYVKKSQKSDLLDIQIYLHHWSRIIGNIDYCLPHKFNPNECKVKNILDIIVELIKEAKFIPGVLAYQIVGNKMNNSIIKAIENRVLIEGEPMVKAIGELREFIKYIHITRKLLCKVTGFEHYAIDDCDNDLE